MKQLELKNVTKAYGKQRVIPGVDLSIEQGEFVVFVGPSGCGKSTLLRMVAGLESVTAGDIQLNGRSLNGVYPSEREVAMVFQSYALYPHLTVEKNMAFPLRMAGLSKAEALAKVHKTAEKLQLGALLKRLPSELSGGQRQRVAIGRAIVRDPALFLFDEPLSNLDAKLRGEMRLYLKQLHQQLGRTMIYVTHDQVEAMTLADRIVVLNQGRIEQVGAPEVLYNQPANRFVAGFIGSPVMNFVDKARFAELGCDVALPTHTDSFGIRPNQIAVAGHNPDLLMQISVVEPLGHARLYYGQLSGVSGEPCSDIPFVVESEVRYKAGDLLPLSVSESIVHCFDSSGARIETLGSEQEADHAA
ncbi:ABC transporter ATP-binding protein [Aliagarivorans marinus]|uniref:ABC transporter ATP-binding protein n=1 Tax=Aliagarivorans marinus TaxID=561965 RepID=UPI000422A9EF|nr:sn-glycerol-3-phosphate ABC transporter ATP-binding protein UgpC [Aliagarivorans marinus]